MTKAEFEKLSTDEKLVRINQKITRIEIMDAVKVGVIILGVLGLMAVVEDRAKSLIAKLK